jgi:uncharacterized membrane protein YhaH (DUF805 family)
LTIAPERYSVPAISSPTAKPAISLAEALGVALLGIVVTTVLAIPYLVAVAGMISTTDPFCGLSDSGGCTLNPDWTLPGIGIAVATLIFGLLATLAVRSVMFRRLPPAAYDALNGRPTVWAATLWIATIVGPFIIGTRITQSYAVALGTLILVIVGWAIQLRDATTAPGHSS